MAEIGWPTWIGVVAEDLGAQRRFYRDVMGFNEVNATEEYVEFDMGENRKLELLAKESANPAYAERRYQVGFDVVDIRSVRQELIDRGVEAVGEIQGDEEVGSYWAYFRDPEGNIFEITQRRI